MNNRSSFVDNRITSVRLFCSIMVLFSHLDWIAGNSTDSFRRLGIYAVAVFFGLSGFLLTDTIFRNGATLVFIKNRLLRIFPGFIGVLFLTSFFLAPVYDAIKAKEFSYFLTLENILYVFNNITTHSLQADINGSLVDSSVPIWNPPLWTLSYELICYFTLFIFFRILGQRSKFVLLAITPTFLFTYLLVRLVGLPIPEPANMIFYYFSFFFIGSFVYLINLHKNLNYVIFLVPFSLMVFLIPRELNTDYFDNRDLFLGIILVPITLMFCFKPRVKRNITNDYSFGIYIYAAPITQLLVLAFPKIADYWLLFAICTLGVTFIFAWLSWNLIERPALRLKERMNK